VARGSPADRLAQLPSTFDNFGLRLDEARRLSRRVGRNLAQSGLMAAVCSSPIKPATQQWQRSGDGRAKAPASGFSVRQVGPSQLSGDCRDSRYGHWPTEGRSRIVDTHRQAVAVARLVSLCPSAAVCSDNDTQRPFATGRHKGKNRLRSFARGGGRPAGRRFVSGTRVPQSPVGDLGRRGNGRSAGGLMRRDRFLACGLSRCFDQREC